MTNHKLQSVPILKMDRSFPIDTSGRSIIFSNHQFHDLEIPSTILWVSWDKIISKKALFTWSRVPWPYTEFWMRRGRQRCQGSLIDPDYLTYSILRYLKLLDSKSKSAWPHSHINYQLWWAVPLAERPKVKLFYWRYYYLLELDFCVLRLQYFAHAQSVNITDYR